MKPFSSLIAVCGVSLCYAQSTNFFLSPGSYQAQLNNGNRTEAYPIYQQHDETLISWTTNWTTVSLIMYQNENASFIALFENQENGSSSFKYDMNPSVNYTWNDVFFLTLWNENRETEGGDPYFSSSYFRINVSDSDPSTSTTPSSTPDPTSSPTSGPQTDEPSSSGEEDDGGLDPNAKVGLGVGIGLGVPALALAGAAVFYLGRRSKANAALQAQQQPPQLPPGTAGYGAGYTGQTPPVSEMGAKPDWTRLSAPSEVDAANVGVGVQSRFQELPGH
ncbi:uncharacterized protein BDV17DRAFT_136248 [Aspergillus undulatus]|uniref:uncharacterized protein n=1 Tax=Aspergillus undulatus TaxID=1810928 RepID=UPI003CCD7EFA